MRKRPEEILDLRDSEPMEYDEKRKWFRWATARELEDFLAIRSPLMAPGTGNWHIAKIALDIRLSEDNLKAAEKMGELTNRLAEHTEQVVGLTNKIVAQTARQVEQTDRLVTLTDKMLVETEKLLRYTVGLHRLTIALVVLAILDFLKFLFGLHSS
jgi:hypothetical protein